LERVDSPNQTTRVMKIATPEAAITRADLAPITFADGYGASIGAKGITARQVALAVFARQRPWLRRLMGLRNWLVGWFGLQPSPPPIGDGDPRQIGTFPIVFESATEIVLGSNDKHLDFRIWIGVQPSEGGSRVSMSTLVRCHKVFGEVYLTLVLPVHRILSRLMLARALVSLRKTKRATRAQA
jgi:hypothetical protein